MAERLEQADTNISNSDSNGWIRMTVMRFPSGKTGFTVLTSKSPELMVGSTRRSLEDIFAGTTLREKLSNVMDLTENANVKYCGFSTRPTIAKLSYGTMEQGTTERVGWLAVYGNVDLHTIARLISTV